MGEEHASMSDLSALIEHLCAKRASLVQTMRADRVAWSCGADPGSNGGTP